MAAILASTDGPSDLANARDRFAAEVATLRGIAERNLPYAKDDAEFVYGLQALMSLENVPVWQVAEMILYAAGDAACPICGHPIKIPKALGADR